MPPKLKSDPPKKFALDPPPPLNHKIYLKLPFFPADCQSDTYFSKGVCESCPEKSTSPEGSVSADACLCNANTYLNNGTCESCPENTYLDKGTCESCPKGQHSVQGSTDVTMCLKSKFYCIIKTSGLIWPSRYSR